MPPIENETPMQPEKPVTPDEKRIASFIIQGVFIVGLVVCIFIDSTSKDYDLNPIIYAIFGSGAIGADNFLRLLNALRGNNK